MTQKTFPFDIKVLMTKMTPEKFSGVYFEFRLFNEDLRVIIDRTRPGRSVTMDLPVIFHCLRSFASLPFFGVSIIEFYNE